MTEASTIAEREVVLGMWRALSRRDWDAIKTFLSADCLYVDMPIPALAARGPDDIVKRLRLLVDQLAGYEGHDGVLVSNGSDVMYEHSETWMFPSGEQGLLKVVTVHKVVDGKITLWKDYWNMATLMSFAPANYFESFGTGDMSWVLDATNLI
ncbi:nuclear transport factor 2 family protein [Mycobacterium paraense]|uniref:limonene-1,2-epoxide hydrolase family protein n=1 Tax=Mycobacterium paraense TaxID=767916 RepID=UPI000A16920B|nr:limonene-1,2-epoxide hydrolase family protein [Mycobacterium paraense]MCV7442764.1 nuclear transport factor 2 family protein [Mycobacterium paraense]ORW46286.1 limonene-1,2-epoxide hydrolase [Mycobacterium paraense]